MIYIGDNPVYSDVVLMRRSKLKIGGKDYYQWRIYVPKELADRIVSNHADEETEALPVVMMLVPAKWYHMLLHQPGPSWDMMRIGIKNELRTMGLHPTDKDDYNLVPFPKDFLKYNDMDPNEAYNHYQIIDKILRGCLDAPSGAKTVEEED